MNSTQSSRLANGSVSIYDIAIYALCLSAPFFVTLIFSMTMGGLILFLYLFLMLLVLYVIQQKKISYDNYQLTFFIAFFAPVLLSFIGLLNGAINSPHGLNYQVYIGHSIGRYINLMALLAFFVVVVNQFNRQATYVRQMRFVRCISWAYFAPLIFIALLGLWQLTASFVPGIPFPFETRSAIHGVADASTFAGITRLTSIANEPSYLAPLLVDGMILALLLLGGLKGKLAAGLLAVLLLFTFSAGGYLNLIMMVTLLLSALFIRALVVMRASPAAMMYFVGLVILTLLAALLLISLGLASIIGDRLPHLLDPEQHTRAFMIFMPFVWAFESGLVNFLFGHGVKSYAMLGAAYTLPSSGDPVHITSNNVFIDIFWEHGLLGLLGMIYFFSFMIWQSIKVTVMSREHWISLLLCLHLIGSSIYRADFASPRFFILVTISLLLLKLANNRAILFRKLV